MADGATGGPSRRGGSLVPLGLAVVRGPSMLPTLRPGDRLLVRYAARPVPGSIVVARCADGVVAVKRATERRNGGWWLVGDAPPELAPHAVDSRQWGVVGESDVLGVVMARVWPRPCRL